MFIDRVIFFPREIYVSRDNCEYPPFPGKVIIGEGERLEVVVGVYTPPLPPLDRRRAIQKALRIIKKKGLNHLLPPLPPEWEGWEEEL